MTLTMLKTIGTVVALGALTLNACGSDADTDTDAGADASSQYASPSGPGAGFGTLDFEAIQECLEAAGLEGALPSDMPTERPSDFPTAPPTEPPSDFPTDATPPEGFPSNGPGGGDMAALQDPEVQAALEACGIELPQPPSGAGQ